MYLDLIDCKNFNCSNTSVPIPIVSHFNMYVMEYGIVHMEKMRNIIALLCIVLDFSTAKDFPPVFIPHRFVMGRLIVVKVTEMMR